MWGVIRAAAIAARSTQRTHKASAAQARASKPLCLSFGLFPRYASSHIPAPTSNLDRLRKKLAAEISAIMRQSLGGSSADPAVAKRLIAFQPQIEKMLDNESILFKLSSSEQLKEKFTADLLARFVQNASEGTPPVSNVALTPELEKAMRSSYPEAAGAVRPSPSPTGPDDIGDNSLQDDGVDETVSEAATSQGVALARVTNDLLASDPAGATECCPDLRTMIQNNHLHCITHYVEHAPSMRSHELSPQHIAAFAGNIPLLQQALGGRKEGVHASSKMGWTPLHFAAFQGHVDAVKELIRLGALNRQDSNGMTPLHIAAAENHKKVCELLLTSKEPAMNVKNIEGATAAHFAAETGAVDILRLLEKFGANLTAKTERLETPLFIAASSGHADAVKFLIEKARGTLNTVDVDGNTPLQAAAHANHDAVAEILIGARADVHAFDGTGHTALHYACWVGAASIARRLIRAGADTRVKNEEDTYPLHYAAQEGYLECVKALAEANADLNVSNSTGATPLLFAIRKKALDVAEYLIERGCDVSKCESHGTTPLLAAIESELQPLVRLLVQKGADVNEKRSDFVTPLHMAIETSQVDLAVELLSVGADPRAKTVEGFTCVHLATEIGAAELITRLVKSGCPVNDATDDGITPLSMAKANKDSDMEAHLRSLGAHEVDVFTILEEEQNKKSL